jgi:parallel beta-helix repeat protein
LWSGVVFVGEGRILVFGEKAVSGIMLIVLLMGMLTFAFLIQPVKASGTIYIRADGSIDPPTAPISTTDNVTYTFTDNIYTDSIMIEKDDIVINGNGYVLNGSVSGFRGFDISYRNNVTVKNVRITKFGDGIYVYHSNSCRVLDNMVTDCWYAIDVMHSSNNNTVSGNIVSDSYGGISVDYSSNDNTIINNTVINSKYLGWGLYLWSSSGNMFSDNIATNNSKGMDIRNAVNNTIHSNNISGNQRGVYLSSSSYNIISQNNMTANNEGGIYVLTHCSNNIISGNIIINNTYHGVELYENSVNNSIIGNTITNNQYGIWLHHYSDYNYVAKNIVTNNTVGIRLSESVNYNRISGNDILANGIGIGLVAFAENNFVYHNNFINNTDHVDTYPWISNVWDSEYPSGGNHWNDYMGIDANGDGIGDTPYVIDADNQDRYPLMHSWGPLPVHNINTGLGYATIQEAINANETLYGHTIFVEAGTYYENVVVNKTVSLVGEAPATTVIDGGGTSDVVRVTANNVIIKNFKIRNSGKYYAPPDSGIKVDASYCNITDNVITENSVGINLEKSSYNSIDSNSITNKYDGIILSESSHNYIRVNNITAHECLGVALSWLSSNNVISGNNMTDNGRGISIADSSNNVVSGNNIIATSLKEGMDAISLLASSNIIISENIITNYWAGIELSYSLSCTISKNAMNGNTYNFGVWGSTLSHFLHSIDVSNLVDGKPVYYLVNQKDLMINPSTYPEIGYLALINSTNIHVEGLMLTANWHGLLLAYTDNSKITYNTIAGARNDGGVVLYCSSNNKIYGNNITDNYSGIILSDSLNNTIASNNITDNDAYGLYLSGSSNNTIHHNNFIKNNKQVSSTDSINIWDDGYPSGGNYWSDYVGVDVKSGAGQDLHGSDGIGDNPYVIDANNGDRYPLMYPYGSPPPPTYALTITATVGGTTDPALGTYSYTANSVVQVTAIPDANYLFECWELDDANVGSANPYSVYMDKDHTLKAVFSPIPPPLSVSTSPLSVSILVGQSVTFTSTVSGGYTPYTYQWYLNSAPVSGANQSSWTFTPTASGVYYVHLKVTDAKGNAAQSDASRIIVATIPVGGYSISIKVHTKAEPIIPYIALIAILTAIYVETKRKTKRKH